jgi:hypothetical protein
MLPLSADRLRSDISGCAFLDHSYINAPQDDRGLSVEWVAESATG